MKKFWLAFAGGVAVAIIAAAIFLYGFAGKYISGVISRACLAAYGSTPEFSGVPSLSLFPLGLDTGPFRWSLNASGFATDIEAKGLKARAELLPLFSGEIRFSEILIDSPAIALKRTKGNALVAGARDSVDGKSFSVYIARLAIRNGSTNIDDALRVSDARLVATNIDPKKGGDLKGDFALTTTLGGQKIRGNLAFTGNARFYSPNLTLRQTSVTFTAGNDSALAVFSPLKLNFDGAVNLEKNSLRATEALLSSPQGSVRLRGESGQDFNSFDGDIRVAADLAKIDKDFGLGLPGMETDISSPVAYRYPEIAFSALALRAGETQGEGGLKIRLPDKTSPLSLTGELTCGIIHPGPSPATTTSPDSGTRTAAKNDLLLYPDINFAFKAAGLEYEKINLKNISFKIKGGKGDYSIPDLKFNWEGGVVNAALSLKAPEFHWIFDGSGKNIEFGAMLRRFGIDGFEKGSASFQAKLAARGTTPDAFAASLSGSGKFSVSGLRASLLEDLAHTLTFFGASRIASGGIKVDAPFAVKNGIADFAGITASSSVISANGSLVLNFVKSSIDSLLRFHIGGLEIPLKISGPFGRISVGLDAGDARP